MEYKPTFFFFHFQCTGSEISDARCGALLLDLHQQHTTKAMGNGRRLHLQTLSLALALVQRSRCEHLFFLQLMGTNLSPFFFFHSIKARGGICRLPRVGVKTSWFNLANLVRPCQNVQRLKHSNLPSESDFQTVLR
jgi:hypothetical protein